MADIPASFELPGNLSIDQFISKTAKKFPLQLTEQYYAVRTFYDSFDWRLYNANLLCEFNQAKKFSQVSLINYENGQLISSTNLEKLPAFVTELDDDSLIVQLLPLLEMRALLPITHLNLQVYQLNILNKEQKTIARLTIEEYEFLKHRVTVEKIKGYEKVAIRLHQFFNQTLALKTANKPLFMTALKAEGRKPGDYSSKLNLKLEPDLSAPKAAKTIYKHLLEAIKTNEQGSINAIDSEFLHDFRVAVRRTRAALNQLKALSPADITCRYSEYFAWLGQITSIPRDLDVYLLHFDDYKNSLPASMREDLNPLRDFLKSKQIAAQKQLATQLKSRQYLTGLIAWEQYLKESGNTDSTKSALVIKQLADLRIWKVYRQVIKQGSVIDANSLPATLHDLRKTCKKLRYLIEFFQSLYPTDKIKILLKSLKELQELLGDFQDCAVQEETLKHFSEEIRDSGGSEQTFLAIAELVQILDAKRCKARSEFSARFACFAASENRAIFNALFVSKA